MCYAANAITGCFHSVTSSTIDAILLDYNGTSTVPINPEQFGRADVTDFTSVTKIPLLFSAQSLHSRTIRRTLKHSANAIAKRRSLNELQTNAAYYGTPNVQSMS